MIRGLAQCPYCKQCEVCLDDHPQLVFLAQGNLVAPCEHLAWVDGRYSQWEPTEHGTNQMIGSVEFRWDFAGIPAEKRGDQVLAYLHELVEVGTAWSFAPAEPFEIPRLSAEGKATNSEGKEHVAWDVDGTALFAQNPVALWNAIPVCQDRWLASFNVTGGA